MKETGINLYQVNTCYITQELEIPKSAEESLSEITQTGFDIIFEQELNGSIRIKATKIEALPRVDYQTELRSLYSRKNKGW